MIPRIGWEVLVQFLGGDPDRPVVLGHFFNTGHPPDYSLPAQKTVTGHRSNSSPGAGGANEVKLDDASGAQQVLINGQHDINVVAANNKTFQVKNNLEHSVGNNRTVSIGGNESASIEGDEQLAVGGDQSVTIGANR